LDSLGDFEPRPTVVLESLGDSVVGASNGITGTIMGWDTSRLLAETSLRFFKNLETERRRIGPERRRIDPERRRRDTERIFFLDLKRIKYMIVFFF
jgi:hypothetical protein